jgi:hypothetical protein
MAKATRLIDLNPQGIAEHLALLKGYKYPIKCLGKGYWGFAYQVSPTRVIKITRDPIEALTVSKLIDKDIPNVVKYYEVKRIKSRKLRYKGKIFAIEMDLGKPLSRGEMDIAHSFIVESKWDLPKIDGLRDLYKVTEENILELSENSKIDSDKYIEIGTAIISAYKELNKVGIYPSDVKGDNMVYIDGKLRIIDFRDYALKGRVSTLRIKL